MKLLREPLVHFLLLGAALFGVFSLLGKVTGDRAAQILVTPDRIQQLISGFNLDFKRPPTTQEVDRLIDDYIREEVLCREAWVRGLDREDPIIRQRLRQRMEFFNEDTTEAAAPTDQQLLDFLHEHPETFRIAGRTPELSEVRTTVESAWVAAHRKEFRDAAYQQLRKNYIIRVEPLKAAAPTTAQTKGPASAQ